MGWYAFNDVQKQKIIYTFYVLPHMKYENKPLQNHAMFVRFIELISMCFFFFQPLHLPLQIKGPALCWNRSKEKEDIVKFNFKDFWKIWKDCNRKRYVFLSYFNFSMSS